MRKAIHGNVIVEIASCGVHPLHDVRVRANGSRTGCAMCEMRIEDLWRDLAARKAVPR